MAPENNGRHGHPLLASRALIDTFLGAPVTSNAREIKRANAQQIESVPVSDSLVSVDVNTPEEYAALSAAIRTDHPTTGTVSGDPGQGEGWGTRILGKVKMAI